MLHHNPRHLQKHLILETNPRPLHNLTDTRRVGRTLILHKMTKEKLQMLFLVLISLGLRLCWGDGGNSGSCSFSPAIHQAPDTTTDHHHHHHHQSYDSRVASKLPEELAEEEDLKLYGFGSDHDDHFHDNHDDHHHDHFASNLELSNLSLWIYAMGCSLLVSMASLICLIILPVLCLQGKPSKTVVDSLAAFGAGAMLGDAFLHQLPHAFGGDPSHSHDGHSEHNHDHSHPVQSHSHSLKDLSVGLSVLFGIILFLIVEKVVRYVEAYSGEEGNVLGHGHHHHGHKKNKLSDDQDNLNAKVLATRNDGKSDMSSEGKMLNAAVSDTCLTEQNTLNSEALPRQRLTTNGASDADKPELVATTGSTIRLGENGPNPSSSNLVFGYLNLFSDGVHNFTDGMALGSAFLLHGSVGGWSRTLFLLAHELPQEVGDFGILVRSGFSVSKALFFNFLSALVALAGTALALLLGQDPGQSALIEGFTAGGFIYIAVAGVLPEMNNGNSTFKSSAVQLTWLILGMAVAVCISLVE